MTSIQHQNNNFPADMAKKKEAINDFMMWIQSHQVDRR